MSKSPGVNSNINDTPQSPWYKTKWSHLLSSGMQLQAVKAFQYVEKLSLLAVASHYSINGSISFCTREFGECH